MESGKLKQRIVGAAVLVSLAVIVLSLTFPSRDHVGAGFDDDVIPPKSAGLSVKVLPLNVPQRDEPPAAPAMAAPEATVVAPPADASMATPAPPEPTPVPPPAVVPPQSEVLGASPAQPASKPAEQHAKTAAPKPAAGASAWVVQLGSFSTQENAFALRDKLRKRHYSAFVDDIPAAGKKRTYRVRVGPELLKSRADTLRDKLEKEFRLKGIVVAHEVN